MVVRSDTELPSGWKLETLSEVLESHRGGVWGSDAGEGPGYPVLRSTNMRGGQLDFTDVARCRISDQIALECALVPGDILVSKSSGSPQLVGLSALYQGAPDNGKYLFSNFTMRIRPDQSRIVPKYLALFLTTSKAEADRRRMAQDTTGLRNLKTREYLAQVLPLPPLPEQRRIVEKIERLLEQSRTAREALDRIPPLLKRFRQAVLAKAFRGELTERDPNDEPGSVLLERIREERRRKWEEDLRARGKDTRKAKYVEPEPPDTSGLSKLPEGWVWAALADVIELLQYGSSVKAEAPDDSGVPMIRMGNIQDGGFDLRSLKYVDEASEDIARYVLRRDDILINRTNSPELVGKAARWDLDGRFIFASYLIRLRADTRVTIPSYLLHVISTRTSREYIARVRHQVAGQSNINSKDIRNIPVPLAPLAEQRQIATKILSLLAVADSIAERVAHARNRAAHVDQAVLARAFRGEL